MAKIAEAFVEIGAKMEPLQAALSKIGGIASAALRTLVRPLSTIGAMIGSVLLDAIGTVSSVVQGTIRSVLGGIVKFVTGTITTVVGGVVKLVTGTISTAFSLLTGIVTAPFKLIGGLFKALTSLRGLLVGGAIGGGAAVIAKSFAEQEEAATRLKAALRAAGEEVDNNFARLSRFASELQMVSTVSDELTLTLLAQAKVLGVQTQSLPDVTKAALGLADALGIENEAALRHIALATQGEFAMLQRYIPALRTATTDTERLAAVNEFASRAFAGFLERTETLSGRLARLKNAIGDLFSAVGGVFLGSGAAGGFVNTIIKGIQFATEFINQNAQKIRDLIVKIFEPVGQVLEKIFSKDFFTVVIGAFAKVGEVVGGWIDAAIAGIQQMAQLLADALNLDKIEGGFIEKLIGGFISLADILQNAAERFVSTIKFGILEIAVAFGERVREFFPNITDAFEGITGERITKDDIAKLRAAEAENNRLRGRVREATLNQRTQAVVDRIGKILGSSGGPGGVQTAITSFLDDAKKRGQDAVTALQGLFAGLNLQIPALDDLKKISLTFGPGAITKELASVVQSVQTATGDFKVGQKTPADVTAKNTEETVNAVEEVNKTLLRIERKPSLAGAFE